jgi:hypothetical protein
MMKDKIKTKVIFRKKYWRTWKHKAGEWEVIAFFPDTAYDGSCRPGNMMLYVHEGQHGEAAIEFYRTTKPCTPREYRALKKELENLSPVGYNLRVMKRMS